MDPRRLSPAVRVFASLSGEVTAEARRARLAEFPDELSEPEFAALTNFLSAPESRIPGVSPRDALALKNGAADALVARAPSGAGLDAVPLESAALSILRDPQPDGNALLSSLALCRERGWTNALPELRRLAASSPSPLVRRAARSGDEE